MKKILSLLLAIVLIAGLVPVTVREAAAETGHTVVIASSDFQGDTDADSASQLAAILAKVRQDYPTADGYLHCGDYTVILQYIASQSESGIAALLQTIDGSGLDIPAANIVLDQGNHDPVGTSGLSNFGNNDPESGKYGVFVIREDNYMWFSGYQGNDGTQIVSEHEPTVQDTAQRLRSYLLAKAAEGFTAPIFVLSHVPLHYSMRTYVLGDSRYAHYITDVLNEGADLGLNIIFLFGHNHSQGWDNYLGASCVYLPRGSKMKIAASGSATSCSEINIGFTYMNAGYTGYYRTDCGENIDDTLTVSVFDITDDSVEIRRYSSNGQHDLKSIGVANEKVFGGNSESSLGLYSPNTATISSPQVVSLTAGADANTVRISNSDELISFLSDCGTNSFADKRVILTNDIVFNTGDSSTWGSTPPSVNLASLCGTSGRFAGVFDGQGHTISGLYINRLQNAGASDSLTGVGIVGYGSSNESLSGYAALFPKTGSCTIKNLRITNSYFAGTYATGALIGCAYGDTTIENVQIDSSTVYATYKQTADPSSGDGGLYEKHCSSGGVMGMTGSDYTINFNNVLYQGTVTGCGRFIGGICGNMQKSHLILNGAGFIGNVNSRYGSVYTGSYLYKENSGGLIGRVSDNINTAKGAVINKSFFIGSLNANSSSTTSGAIAGRCDKCTVTDFYANTGSYASFLGQTDCTDVNAQAYCSFVARSVLESEGAVGLIGLNSAVWEDNDGIGPMLIRDSFDPGPASDTVSIGSAEELLSFFIDCNTNGVSFAGKTVLLTDDITFNTGNSADWASNTPAVNLARLYGTNGRFAGVFDGQGHTISGLYIDRLSYEEAYDSIIGAEAVAYGSSSESVSGYAGLFARTGSCEIKNLRITNSYFAGTYATGALIGCAYGDTAIENVQIDNTAVFASYKQTGNPSGGDSGLYEKHSSSGGVVGMTNGNHTISFENVVYQGTVTGCGRFVGGICGNMQMSHLILDGVGFIGNVNSRYGEVYSGSYLYKENSGGLIGRVSDNINASSGAVINKCFFIGSLNANASSTTSGAIAGRCDICTVTDFYANTGSYAFFLGQSDCTDVNAQAYCSFVDRSILEGEGAVGLTGLARDAWYDSVGVGPLLSAFAPVQTVYNVEDFKIDPDDASSWTVPTTDGKIFAGWYADSSFDTPYTEAQGIAVPKFVDKDVLKVAAQASVTDNSVRFLSTVDECLDYPEVGFIVSVHHSGFDWDVKKSMSKVYTGILAGGVSKNAADVSGCGESAYISFCRMTGIPEMTGVLIKVTAFWVTADGTTVTGETRNLYLSCESGTVTLSNDPPPGIRVSTGDPETDPGNEIVWGG